MSLAIATYTPHDPPQRRSLSHTVHTHLPARPCLIVEGKIRRYPGVDPVQCHSPLGRAVDGESYERGVGEGRLGGVYLIRSGVSGV